MKIKTLEIDNESILTDFYNEQFSKMPYCYPVTPDEFEIGIRCHEERDDEPYADLSDESFLVVENGDSTILGFAHVAIWRKGEEASRIGLYPIE